MNHKNKHLMVSYFSHSFMAGQALHMHNNLNSSSVNCCLLLGKLCIYITTKNVGDKSGLHVCKKKNEYLWLVLAINCILGNFVLDFNGQSLVNIK